MNGLLLLGIACVILIAAYLLYGRYLVKTWGIDPNAVTPAVEKEDGVDYVPSNKWEVFAHQFSSIAGAGPVTGPVMAMMFGWLPAFLWIIIGGIFFYLIGYGWIGLIGWILGGILSDIVLKIGGYQKFKITVLSYACFCLGIMGCPANLWFAGEAYWENIHTSMGDQYANTLQSLMPSWMLYVGFVLLFVGGILGALLGHKMLKKHFERAGIV